jgi:hypothetical protein
MAIATEYESRPGLKRCYAALEVVIELALREDDSLFTPGRPIWTLENRLFAIMRGAVLPW